MATEFLGQAAPLSDNGFASALAPIKSPAAALWAILGVETNGHGFLADRRPVALFERHIFSRQTNHQYDQSHPDISNPTPGGYGAPGAHQYDRINAAITLNRTAALNSASWGIGQIMGFNFAPAGYQSAEAMVTDMMISEDLQLLAMTTFIAANNWESMLANNDWRGFAKSYNGPSFEEHAYDVRLASSYQKYLVALPNTAVRAVQTYLTYLGANPGSIDGMNGKLTCSALNDFQRAHNLPVSNTIDNSLLDTLQSAVAQLQ